MSLIVISISSVSASLRRIHSPVIQNSAEHWNVILSKSVTDCPELFLAPCIRTNNHHKAVRQPSQNARVGI